jgi:hypothetical protein
LSMSMMLSLWHSVFGVRCSTFGVFCLSTLIPKHLVD